MDYTHKISILTAENQALRKEIEKFHSSPYWRLANIFARVLTLVAPENTLRGHIVVFLANSLSPAHISHAFPAQLPELDKKYDVVAMNLRKSIFVHKR